MLGAIAGDIIGSIYERGKASTWDFPLFGSGGRFTDDSVLTAAVADALLSQAPYAAKFREYHHSYPHAGYGGRFKQWANQADAEAYNSFGNGSAMRVSPVAYAFDDLEAVLAEAQRSAEPTHNHPEGIKGAQAVAACIFWARQGWSKDAIRQGVIQRFGYSLDGSIETLHQTYTFDVTCQGSVPQAILAFLAAGDFESAIRNAVYIGGDSDTLACMAGSIAEAFYGGVPAAIQAKVLTILDERLTAVVNSFYKQFQGRQSDGRNL